MQQKLENDLSFNAKLVSPEIPPLRGISSVALEIA